MFAIHLDLSLSYWTNTRSILPFCWILLERDNTCKTIVGVQHRKIVTIQSLLARSKPNSSREYTRTADVSWRDGRMLACELKSKWRLKARNHNNHEDTFRQSTFTILQIRLDGSKVNINIFHWSGSYFNNGTFSTNLQRPFSHSQQSFHWIQETRPRKATKKCYLFQNS